MTADADISYLPRGRIGGTRVGAHPSRALGALGSFRDQVPFMAFPDARRIDMRVTLRDPFEGTFVRRFQQRAAIDLYALVDLSGSLDFEGRGRKRDLVSALCTALASSACRAGDRFGLIGCDDHVREDVFLPASRRREIASEVAERLAHVTYAGVSAAGLTEAAPRLVGARKMVFLVSDFMLPIQLLRDLFERLAQHDVVPVVIGDTSEDALLPDWGLLELADLETDMRRLVFMRPKLKRQWLERERERRAAIWQLARAFGRTPITIADTFDVDRFSRLLLES